MPIGGSATLLAARALGERIRTIAAFTNGAHLAVAEVDVETGKVRVLRYVAVDDCGRIVNPALVEGQIAGGIAQGLGGALSEHCVYDDAGQLLSATLMDYALPTFADVPPIETHHLETPAPGTRAASRALAKRARRGRPPRSSTRSTTRWPRSA